MSVLSRIGVALDADLLERFDDFISRLGHNFLEQLFEYLRFLESPVTILRKRGVMRNFLIEAKTSEPAPGKMHAQFLNELALTADAV